MNIKEDANDSIQFNLFQKNADMFFQCALISKEEDDDRKRICGFGIYEDCAAEIGVSEEFGFSYLPGCAVVIYAFEHISVAEFAVALVMSVSIIPIVEIEKWIHRALQRKHG